jgi:hypothetical protein
MTPFLIALIAAAGIGLGPLGTEEMRATPSAGPMQAPRPAPPATIASEVMVLHATNNNTGIDPRIGHVPALSKPPFSSYNSYRLLTRTYAMLDRGKPELVRLPTGNDLRVVYKDAIVPTKLGQLLRFVVAASIQKPNGNAILPLVEYNANAGEWFWVGGQAYQGGSLFIGIKLD